MPNFQVFTELPNSEFNRFSITIFPLIFPYVAAVENPQISEGPFTYYIKHFAVNHILIALPGDD